MASKTVKVPNISCGHCTSTIEREVSELEGVTSVKADKDSKMVTVEWNEPSVAWTEIAELLNEIGYPAERDS
jgi:copper ion binding protein